MSKNIGTLAAGLLALTSIAAASVGCQPQASEQTAANPTEFVEQTETVDAVETEAASTFEPTAEPTSEPTEPTEVLTAEPTETPAEPTEEPVEERFVTTGYGRVKFTKATEEFFIEIKRRKIDLRKNFNDEEINVDDINLSKAEIYDTQTGIVLICEDYFFIEGLGWTRQSVCIFNNVVLIGSDNGFAYLYTKKGLQKARMGGDVVITESGWFICGDQTAYYKDLKYDN